MERMKRELNSQKNIENKEEKRIKEDIGNKIKAFGSWSQTHRAGDTQTI